MPLKDGRMLYVYYYGLSSHRSICEIDANFGYLVQESYDSIVFDGFEDYIESTKLFEDIIRKYPIQSDIGEFYFRQEYKDNKPFGDKILLSKEEWDVALEEIDALLISDSEWIDCSDFS